MIKINEYFNGQVKSLGFDTAMFPASVGVMEVGNYEFSTGKAEVMRIISGLVSIKLADSDHWLDYASGTFFHVPANNKFQVKVKVVAAYFCEYHD